MQVNYVKSTTESWVLASVDGAAVNCAREMASGDLEKNS
jgi:hypothetical protein